MLSRSARPVIDMRSRPAFLHKFFGSTPSTPEYEVVRWLNKRVGSRDIDHFARARDPKGFVAEMDAAGITSAVMVARSVPGVRVSNDDLAAVAKTAPDRLLAVASVDPIELGVKEAVAEATRAVKELGHKGINVDAGFYAEPLKSNDERLMPLYEACQTLGIPAFVMSGPTTPNLEFNDPFAVETVAKTFPKLKIVCCHGFYPRVADIITIAFRNENIFVSPDMYTFAPGGGLYVEAANGFMKDQFLFGSSYPFRPMKQGVEDFQALGLSDEAYAAATYQNAQRIFGVTVDA
ncbi:MAG: amidohydrolase family protein [Proteobacteria bacterium]|nr:amidohydrolase family protein [Pseudomonadota bacterium]